MSTRAAATLFLGLALALALPACAAADDDGEDDELAGSSEEELDDSAALAAQGLRDFFPIAANSQPAELFAMWKARGANTQMMPPAVDSHLVPVDVGEWTRAAAASGFKVIRSPSPNAEDDAPANASNVLAWSWIDEPELNGIDPSTFPAWAAAHASRPTFVNFVGARVLSAKSSAAYAPYLASGSWFSQDIYPVNDYHGKLQLVGQATGRLRRWAKGKPTFAYVESSDFNATGPKPNAAQVRSSVLEAIINGARGIFYFSSVVSGCGAYCGTQDATPAPVAHEMTKLHAVLNNLASVLQGPVNPKGGGIHVGGPLDAGWRKGPHGVHYYFVVNPTGRHLGRVHMKLLHEQKTHADLLGEKGRNIAIGADGVLTDTFGPYESHIYKVN